MHTSARQKKQCVMCLCVIHGSAQKAALMEQRSPSCYQGILQTHLGAESRVCYRQHVGKAGHLQGKAVCFMVKDGHRVKSLKPFLTLNPSLSRCKEKTTLSLRKKWLFPNSSQRTETPVQDTRSWFNYHYPRLFKTSPLQKSATKQRLKASPVEGREVASTSPVGCSTYRVNVTGAELKH